MWITIATKELLLLLKNGRFTDINLAYDDATNETRTNKQVLADMEKAGTKVIRLSKKLANWRRAYLL